jgi:uncharacterized protein (TIGR03437 family)
MISTVAGNGTQGYSGDGGPATSAQLSYPQGVAVDSAGNLFIVDLPNNRIRKVAPSGIISTVAGNGTCCYSGDGGPATSAQLSGPWGAAVDSAGNLYISDESNNRIRKVVPGGTISTVAGNGTAGYSGDGGPATSAQLYRPMGVAVGSTGNLYIADSGNQRIRKVTPDGTISTVAGNGTQAYSGDGGPAISAELSLPGAVAVDSAGNLYIADTLNNSRIRKVAPDGTISTVAGNGIMGYSGDGGPATSAQLNGPWDVAVDSAGSLYIADTWNNRIRKVAPDGTISTVAGSGTQGPLGDGGPATSAPLFNPRDVAVDYGGNLYISDASNNRIRKVAPGGTISTVAGNGTQGYSGDGGLATSAQLDVPEGLAVDTAGRVYVADSANKVIRVLAPISCTYSVAPTSLQIPVSGGNFTVSIQTAASCAWAVSGLPTWITVSGSTTGSGSTTINLVAAANSGAPRSAQISVGGIAVTVSQASSVLLISTGGVGNGASYTGPAAPGSIAAIFGNFLLAAPVSGSGFPIPTSLGGLSFQFSGAPLAPLFYANLGQVNAQVPWELAGQSQTTISVSKSGQTSASQTVNLATYAPGIFAVNGGGTGQGATLDAANHLVDLTNPANAGSTVVQIYCTGLGPVTNQPATGAPSPESPLLAKTTTLPVVMIGGAQASVQFSGLTPDAVGLYQVNALVPQGAARGSAVPVMVSIGGVQSNTVTIAVQ